MQLKVRISPANNLHFTFNVQFALQTLNKSKKDKDKNFFAMNYIITISDNQYKFNNKIKTIFKCIENDVNYSIIYYNLGFLIYNLSNESIKNTYWLKYSEYISILDNCVI